ncbi:hypothetical protein LVJ94_22635 [Pendulispora rubella]|uniref:Uncharacterized protein n=1 Tax=Pendulispora rubella TaxID=2741070 RepID=A0ABZ2LGF4_9BACT
MKRWFGLLIPAALGLTTAAVLSGCPIYDGDSGHRVCTGGGDCYDCPNSYYSNECVPYQCGSSYDCPSGYSCQNNYCVGGGKSCSSDANCPYGQVCGSDRQCHNGDCSTNGCPNGGTCKLSGGKLQCIYPDAGPPTDAGPAQCTGDGTQDICATGSICLHHNCYITCSPDAGADACKGGEIYKLTVCRPVTAANGSYNVCGSETDIGNECDAKRPCSSPTLCIDGYCK